MLTKWICFEYPVDWIPDATLRQVAAFLEQVGDRFISRCIYFHVSRPRKLDSDGRS